MPVSGSAACVEVHEAGYVARFCSKWKHLVMQARTTRPNQRFM